jgi:hypothetical protein
MTFLKDLKVTQLAGKTDEAKRMAAKCSNNHINLSDQDLDLLSVRKGPLKKNMLDMIFDARYELGSGFKDSP